MLKRHPAVNDTGYSVILLSLVKLLWQANHGNEETCRYIVKLRKDIGKEGYVHTAFERE